MKGSLERKGDSDVVYLLADSNNFTLEFKNPPVNAEFMVELFWGDHTKTNRKYNLKKTKYIKSNLTGGFYVRIYSTKGSGEWEFSYQEKEYRTIELTWRVSLTNKSKMGTASKLQLWLPVIETFEPFQEVLENTLNIEYKEIVEDNLGNKYYFFEFYDLKPKTSIEISMNYKILLKSNYQYPYVCEGELINDFLDPEPLIESNDPYIINLANDLIVDDTTICEKVESIYNFVLKEVKYEENLENMNGALVCLKKNKGDCNEFTDAIIALCRALGIPARKGNGIVFFENDNLSFHAFSEVYIPGVGWTVADSTMCCFLTRPPIYIYQYVGENPSILREPDIENCYVYYWWDGTIQPDIWTEHTLEAKEIE